MTRIQEKSVRFMKELHELLNRYSALLNPAGAGEEYTAHVVFMDDDLGDPDAYQAHYVYGPDGSPCIDECEFCEPSSESSQGPAERAYQSGWAGDTLLVFYGNTCLLCDGQGEVNGDICLACNGHGTLIDRSSLTEEEGKSIEPPAVWLDGTRFMEGEE